MEKKRLVISYTNAPEDVLQAIKKKYPLGYSDYVMKVNKPNNDFFYAITIDTENASYLVKVDVKIDSITEEELEKETFSSGGDDDVPDDDSSFGAEDDNIESFDSIEGGYDE